MSGSLYEIGMRMTLAGNAAQALAGIVAQMGHIHQLEGKIEKGFHNWNAAIIGGGMALAGVGVAKMAEHFEESGEKLIHAQNVLQNALPKTTAAMDMAIAKTAAYDEAGRNLNTTFEENIESLRDLYSVFQDIHESAHLLPVFNNLSNALSFVKPEAKAHDFGADRKNIAAAARAFDLLTGGDAEMTAVLANKYRNTISALGDNASGQKLLAVVKGAGAAAQGWSKDEHGFIIENLMEWANGGLGTGAGNVLAMMHKNAYGGRTSNMQMSEAMVHAGLQSDVNRILNPATGKPTKDFAAGSGFQAELFSKDPLEWANKVRELWSKSGVDLLEKGEWVHHHVDVNNRDQMNKIVTSIWGAQKSMHRGNEEALLPQSNAMLNRGRIATRKAGEDIDAITENDPKMWRSKLKKQKENVEEAVGQNMVQPMIDHILKPLTLALKDMSQWAIKNPNDMKAISEAIVMIGAGLFTAGTFTVAVKLASLLSPTGAIIGGVMSLTLALSRLALVDWNKIAPGLEGFLNQNKTVKGVVDKTYEFATDPVGYLGRTWNMIHDMLPGKKVENTPSFELAPINITRSIMTQGAGAFMASGLGHGFGDAMPKAVEAAKPGVDSGVSSLGTMIGNALSRMMSNIKFDVPHVTPPPPSTEKHSSIIQMNLDGKPIGEVVAGYIGRSGTYPLSPSFNDSHGNFSLPAVTG